MKIFNNKENKKRLAIRLAAILLVILIAVVMFIIGRGHTVYFDNKSLQYNGQNFEPEYKIEVYTGGEKAASLRKNERGMADTMGQSFSMELNITKEKGGEATRVRVNLPLPYSMDGIIINLPALLAGQPSEVYLTEFIPTPSSEVLEDEEIITDEAEGLMNFGESDE